MAETSYLFKEGDVVPSSRLKDLNSEGTFGTWPIYAEGANRYVLKPLSNGDYRVKAEFNMNTPKSSQIKHHSNATFTSYRQ